MKKEDFVPGKFLRVVNSSGVKGSTEVFLLIEKVNEKNIFTKDCFSLGIVGKSAYERKHKQARWSFDSPLLFTDGYENFKYTDILEENEIPQGQMFRVVK